MRSYDPKDTYDVAEAQRLGAEPWMLDLLPINPEYTSWGPYEDYMWKKGEAEGGKAGWDARFITDTWEGFGWSLDDLNEVVNFYFTITREKADCDNCAHNGYHPDAQWVTESFYRHSSPFNRDPHSRDVSKWFAAAFQDRQFTEVHTAGSFPDEATLAKYKPEFRAFCEAMRDGDGFWSDKITQDETDALVAEDRMHRLTGATYDKEASAWVGGRAITAEEVNALQNERGRALDSHDAINRSILIRARCERFGIPTTCPKCDGHGYVYTAPKPTLGLVLWMLHPRKGCSRGIHIKEIRQDQLSEVFTYLRKAAQRNADRFSKIPVSDPVVPA